MIDSNEPIPGQDSPDAVVSVEPEKKISKVELYRDDNYVSLYRYENPSIEYDHEREGIVSKADLIGSWYTESLSDLKTYTIQRIQGIKGGRFAVVRIRKDLLKDYDATILPETKEMDIEKGNYIIPSEVGEETRIEIPALFKDEWEGGKNVSMKDWGEIESYIDDNLSDEALINRLE